MGCGCNKGSNGVKYEVVDGAGNRKWGPSDFKTTADAMANSYRTNGTVPDAVVREVKA